MKVSRKNIYIMVITLVLGLFIGLQARSYETINEILLRNNESNAFQEIQILRQKNKNLENEVSDLEILIDQLSDQNLALEVLEEEMLKYRKLSGRSSIFGTGVTMVVSGNLTTPWITDVSNAFFNSGAQALSVNGIRITNQTVGFDTLPQGQILLNGSILSPPYEFNAIGESESLMKILTLPGGIVDRVQKAFPDLQLSLVRKEIVQVD